MQVKTADQVGDAEIVVVFRAVGESGKAVVAPNHIAGVDAQQNERDRHAAERIVGDEVVIQSEGLNVFVHHTPALAAGEEVEGEQSNEDRRFCRGKPPFAQIKSYRREEKQHDKIDPEAGI